MEAGDCEGRLPPLFCARGDVRCQVQRLYSFVIPPLNELTFNY